MSPDITFALAKDHQRNLRRQVSGTASGCGHRRASSLRAALVPLGGASLRRRLSTAGRIAAHAGRVASEPRSTDLSLRLR